MLLQYGSSSTSIPVAALLAVPVLFGWIYPWLAGRLFHLSAISESQLASLGSIPTSFRQSLPRRLYLWDTGGSICNAAVLGCLPGARFLVVSDVLWHELSPRSVVAILAHEAGHHRLRHIPVRLCMVLAGGLTSLAAIHCLDQAQAAPAWQMVVVVLGAGYMGLMLHFVSPLLEFQADAFALDVLKESSGVHELPAQQLIRALSQCMELSGQPMDQRTWLHPSFEQRRQAILQCSSRGGLAWRLRVAIQAIVGSQLILAIAAVGCLLL